MISAKEAARQLRRLDGLEYFQTLSQEAIDELVRALRRAPDHSVLDAAVSEWLLTQPKRPTPADLTQLIQKHQGHHAECKLCCDTGLVVKSERFAACACETGQRQFIQDWTRAERRKPQGAKSSGAARAG